MNTAIESAQKRFYLISVDLLQGIMVIWFVIGHTGLWWDPTYETKYPNVPVIISLFISLALIVVPGFLFLYGFNTVNSLLRRLSYEERNEARYRTLKRGIIFFLVAEFAEIASALITSPKYILNALFTWELFHQFSFSTFLILLIFEIAWALNKRYGMDYNRICTIEFCTCIFLVLSYFLIYHDYTQSELIKGLFVDLNIQSILQRAVFEYGQAPIIPFVLFPLVGGLIAIYIDLPNETKSVIKNKIRNTLIVGLFSMIVGIYYLSIEKYTSTVIWYPASSPLVFLAIGTLTIVTLISILYFDLNSLYSHQTISNYLIPFVLLSKITLTVYIIHNIAYIFPSDLSLVRFLLPDIHIVLIAGFLYAMCFAVIAIIWQRWKFKYSLEWIIWRVQKSQWFSYKESSE